MTKYITANVNVRHPETFAVHTLTPGDEVPEWAEELITNPDVTTDLPDVAVDPDSGEDAGGEGAQDSDEGKSPAGEDQSGDADKGESGDADKGESGEDDKGESGEDDAVTRAELEKRAKALRIRFNKETTEAELTALIASKE